MESSSGSGGKVGHVSISITTDEENQPTPPAAAPAPARPQLKFYFAVLYVLAIWFMILLIMFPALFQNERQSTFKTRAGFLIIMTIVSVSVAILASAILIFTSHCLQSLMRDIHYTIFRSIGYFSAASAYFCLIVVLFVPLDLNPWIAYPFICILFTATLYVCCLIWKHVCVRQLDDDQFQLPVRLFAGLFITLPLCLALYGFMTHGLQWIKYTVSCLNLMILGASCFFTAYMTLFYGRKQLGTSSSDPTGQQDDQSSSTINLAN